MYPVPMKKGAGREHWGMERSWPVGPSASCRWPLHPTAPLRSPPTSFTDGTPRPVRAPARGPDVLSQPSAHRILGWGPRGCWGRWPGARLHALGDGLGKLEKHQGKRASKREDAAVGTPTHLVRLGPLRGSGRCKAKVTLSGFQVGKQRPGEVETHPPLPVEPGELWALLRGPRPANLSP